MDMRFYWLRDKTNLKRYHIYWCPGADNLADFYTKHHSPVHHQQIRSKIMGAANNISLADLQGCIGTSIYVLSLAVRRT